MVRMHKLKDSSSEWIKKQDPQCKTYTVVLSTRISNLDIYKNRTLAYVNIYLP